MGEWTVGLFGCFGNCGLCIKSFLLPCVVYGQLARAVGNSCCVHCLFFFIPVFNAFVMGRTRGKIRDKRNIKGGGCGDILTSLFCTGCSLSQEAVEVVAMVRDIEKSKRGEELQDVSPPGSEEPDETEELANGTEQSPVQEGDGQEPVETDKVEIERE